jgi:hypothetical protein
MTTITQDILITIPLDSSALKIAYEFSQHQDNPIKKEQVFLNTLAVYSVNTYLQWVEIATNLDLSYSWHPIHQKMSNIADLMIPNLGRIECYPLKPNQEEIVVSYEALRKRIGYVFVQFQDSLEQVELLGFVLPKDIKPSLSLTELKTILKPVDYILSHIYNLQESIALLESETETLSIEPVKETVALLSPIDIISHFQQIYQEEEPYNYSEKCANILLGEYLSPEEIEGDLAIALAKDRQLSIESRAELQDFAFQLLEKMAEIWQE